MAEIERSVKDGADAFERLRARLRCLTSASAATGSASAFVVAAALLSFVPDAPVGRSAAWALRGTLDPIAETGAFPPAALQHMAKPV